MRTGDCHLASRPATNSTSRRQHSRCGGGSVAAIGLSYRLWTRGASHGKPNWQEEGDRGVRGLAQLGRRRTKSRSALHPRSQAVWGCAGPPRIKPRTMTRARATPSTAPTISRVSMVITLWQLLWTRSANRPHGDWSPRFDRASSRGAPSRRRTPVGLELKPAKVEHPRNGDPGVDKKTPWVIQQQIGRSDACSGHDRQDDELTPRDLAPAL
jgi:hypothetical protein